MTQETPLRKQQRCSNDHICSGSDNYCRECGEELGDGVDYIGWPEDDNPAQDVLVRTEEFVDMADSEIIEYAISKVPDLEPGRIDTVDDSVSVIFSHSSADTIMEKVADITGATLRYNDDGTVDYGPGDSE